MVACVRIVPTVLPIGIAFVGCLGIESMDSPIPIAVWMLSRRLPFFPTARDILSPNAVNAD